MENTMAFDRGSRHSRTAENGERLQPVLLGDRRPDRRTEEVGVEKVPHIG